MYPYVVASTWANGWCKPKRTTRRIIHIICLPLTLFDWIFFHAPKSTKHIKILINIIGFWNTLAKKITSATIIICIFTNVQWCHKINYDSIEKCSKFMLCILHSEGKIRKTLQISEFVYWMGKINIFWNFFWWSNPEGTRGVKKII